MSFQFTLPPIEVNLKLRTRKAKQVAHLVAHYHQEIDFFSTLTKLNGMKEN